MDYDTAAQRLLVGHGYIENVTPAMWTYEVSGMHVLEQWFSYRRANRDKPPMGDKRPPSKLEKIRPDHWLPEYTTELLDVLHVLGLLVDLEPVQADLLSKVCDGPLVSHTELADANAFELPADCPTSPFRAAASQPATPSMF